MIDPEEIKPVVIADPDDDAVVACAISSQSEFIVSGDSHLLMLRHYQHIRVLSAIELINEIS